MNPDWLFRHFEQISQAPDAIPRLRRFIVDLAILGKLASRGLKEPTTVELLAQVQEEKRRLLKEGEMKRKKPQGPILEEEIPIQGASHVVFVRLAEIASIERGTTGIQKAKPGEYPLVTLAEDRAFCDSYQYDTKAVIIPLISSTGHGHASMKRLHYQEGKFAVGNILCAVIPYAPQLVSARFLYEYFCAYREPLFVSKMIGTANVSLTIKNIGETPVPIISPRAQKQVDELMGLCGELEVARAKLERRRDRLVAATLHGLNNGDDSLEPGGHPTFEESARFYFNHLPRLATRPEHIQQLRQTILNLAVHGKIVQQRTEEGSGEELLCRLKATHPENRKFGASRGKGHSPLDQLDCPAIFPVPPTWRWAYLDFLCEQIADIDHNMPKTVAHGVPFISAKDLKDDGTIDFSNSKMISEDDYERLSRKVQMRSGDIVYSRIGARLGKARIVYVDTRFLISYSCCLVRPMHEFVDKHYLQRFLDSNLALNQAHKGAQSIGVPDLGLGEIKEFRIPLPPLAEQHRIVAKVDELMTLCNELEVRLTEGATTRHQFLEATLHEALTGHQELHQMAAL